MTKHLLVAASALVVGLSFGSNAYAWDDNDIANAKSATAVSLQLGEVEDNFAKGTVGSNDTGAIGGTGLINVQQNNGANSLLQDANTLGAILNCACTNSSSSENANTTSSLALALQVASVEGNKSIGAENTASAGTESSSASVDIDSEEHGGGHHDKYGSGGGHSDEFSFDGDFSHAKTWAHTETAVGSTNFIAGVSGTGLINVSQNNGNNSMLQSSNTVAAIIGK